MIRLIATDLDGTLLTPDKRLPEGIFPLIEKFAQKGVLFAPASGRQIANLKQLFAPVKDKVLFLAENGAIVSYRDEILFQDPVPKAEIPRALAEIRGIAGLYPMLCTPDYAYIESMEKPFSDYAFASYTHCRYVERLENVMELPVLKIAIYDAVGSAVNCMQKLPKRLPSLRTMISGADWCDVSKKDANKGKAISFLQRHFSIAKEDCVAFGDHMNDFEMLKESGISFVPANAYPAMLNAFPNHIPSNGENGVCRTLERLLEEL